MKIKKLLEKREENRKKELKEWMEKNSESFIAYVYNLEEKQLWQ